MKKWCVYILVMVMFSATVNLSLSETGNEKLPKGFAFNNPEEYIEYPNFHGGTGTIKLKEMFGIDDYKTNHSFLMIGVIPPGASIGEYRSLNADELYIIIKGRVDITVNGRTGRITEGTMVPCKIGESFGLYNPSGKEVLFAWLVTKEKKGKYNTEDLGNDLTNNKCERPCPFAWSYMKYGVFSSTGPRAHLGKGIINGTLGSINHDYFKTHFLALFMALPPDCSIGYHMHEKVEEHYLLMNGHARGTVNDVTMDMEAGDVTLCSFGDRHGIFNNGDEDIYIFYTVKSANPDGRLDYKNLGDDLSKK